MSVNYLTLYSRHGCHLCDDMQNLLHSYLDGSAISVDVIYIDNDRILEQEYGSRIPVLKAGELEICHYFLDVKALEQYISEVGNPLN